MELTGINKKTAYTEASPLGNGPIKSSAEFAAMLKKGVMTFETASIPTLSNTLSAHFDAPREAEVIEEAPRPIHDDRAQDTRAEDNDDHRPVERDERPRQADDNRRDDRSDDQSHAAAKDGHDDRPEERAEASDQGSDDTVTKTEDGADETAAKETSSENNPDADDGAKGDEQGVAAQNQGKKEEAGAKAGQAVAQAAANQSLNAVKDLGPKVTNTEGKDIAAEAKAQAQGLKLETTEGEGLDQEALNALLAAKTKGKKAAKADGANKGADKNAAVAAQSKAQSELQQRQAEDLNQALAGLTESMKVTVNNQQKAAAQTPMATLAPGAAMANEGLDDGLFNGFGNAAGTAKAGGLQSALTQGQGKGQNKGQNASAQANAQAALNQTNGQAAQNAQAANGQSFEQMLKAGKQAATQTMNATQAATQAATTASADGGQTVTAGQGNQQTQATQPTQQTQQAHRARTPYVPQQEVVEQVKVQIAKGAKTGMDNIKIQLTPEKLGKIEVRLEVHQDGAVRALVIADNRDTLDMLRQDQRGLENALKEAGLKTDGGAMQFEHREGHFERLAKEQGQGANNGNGDNSAKAGNQDQQAANENDQSGHRSIISEDKVDVYL